MATPASASQPRDAVSAARTVKYEASTMVKTSSASGLLKRNIRVATGVRAKTAAPARAAQWAPRAVSGWVWPGACRHVSRLRRTVLYSTPTLATPSRASGTRMLHELRPNSLTDSAISQMAAGGLSTVMLLPPSREPKNHATQFSEPACAAAE